MEISTQFIVLVPVVLGVVQAIKVAGLSSRWSPLVSLVLGVAGSFVISGLNFNSASILQGIVAGLSASGLWSSTKSTLGN